MTHALCFYYVGTAEARAALESGTIPLDSQCRGVPVSLRGPDELGIGRAESNWGYQVEAGAVVLVLVVPRRLLWAFPEEPRQQSSLDTRGGGAFRVIPAHLVEAIFRWICFSVDHDSIFVKI